MAVCSRTGEWASGAVEGRLNVFPCPSEGSEFPLATEQVGSRRFFPEALREKSRGAFLFCAGQPDKPLETGTEVQDEADVKLAYATCVRRIYRGYFRVIYYVASLSFMPKMRVLGTCGDEKNILTLRRSFVDIALNVTKDSGQMQNVRGKLINRKRIGTLT